MSNDIDFEAYLFVSPQKIIISINEKINFKTIYQKEILINIGLKEIDYKEVDNFLNENIFLIEKKFQKFVKKINIIIESKVFFTVLVSIKDKNHDETISQKTLDHLLNEAKSQCEETIYGKKITHMIIDNYLINNKNHQFLTFGKKYNSFSLDLRFICLSKDIIKNFEQTLSKYQISIDQIVNAEYIKNFFEYERTDIFNMANKIINGCNENEVKIINKKYEKKGVFERLFDLFS
tara:strand:+ start:3145 stop:3849 length:705 start_codon:yes stop_codon:yes gene_type:complete